MGATVEAFGEYHPPTRWAEWGYTVGKGAGKVVHTLLPIGKIVWVKNGIFAVVTGSRQTLTIPNLGRALKGMMA